MKLLNSSLQQPRFPDRLCSTARDSTELNTQVDHVVDSALGQAETEEFHIQVDHVADSPLEEGASAAGVHSQIDHVEDSPHGQAVTAEVHTQVDHAADSPPGQGVTVAGSHTQVDLVVGSLLGQGETPEVHAQVEQVVGSLLGQDNISSPRVVPPTPEVEIPTYDYCNPILDHTGQCICNVNAPYSTPIVTMVTHMVQPNSSMQTRVPHFPYLPPLPGHSFPMCRNNACIKMYIDDASVAESVDLKKSTVPAHETYEPKGHMNQNKLAIPGCHLALEHRLRDVEKVANAQGMKLNTKKTNLIVFNGTHTLQAAPFVSTDNMNPLLCVAEL